ncbi:MAG: RecX family transcriptional regulator [Clostridia bacterium]|nr:RecX family transcriptional regulator [Clostridia bacterium]
MYTLEEFDKEKTRVLKYIMFKKRSEYEVRNKFSKTIEESLLEDIIEYLKEAGYINDRDYIERLINEFISLKNLSLKEVKYKLMSKGINTNLIEDYMYSHSDELEEYEQNSATHIAIKKSTSMEEDEIKNFLYKKGYRLESIKNAIDEIK